AGLGYVLACEVARLGDPVEDLAWPLVRAWRFGVDHRRLGGIGEIEPYLERYRTLTGRDIPQRTLAYWEIVGNIKWGIGALTQSRRQLTGQTRSDEFAVLGRLPAELERARR